MGDEVLQIGEGSRPNLRKYAKEAADRYLVNRKKSFKTAERWFISYLQYGETPWETKKWLKSKVRGGSRRVWTVVDTHHLQTIIDNDPGLYLDELVDRMHHATQVQWSPTTIWTKMREELRYSLQRVSERALEQDMLERYEYQKALEVAVTTHPEKLVYIDESQKGRNASRRLRWWSPRGRTPVRLDAFDYEPKKRYTLMAACDINGFIPGACDIVLRGSSTQEELGNDNIGTVGTERIELWIEQCLVRFLGDFVKGEPRSIVVLDNATVHHSEKIRDLIYSTGAIILYLAPYSPDLNPIELMFNEYKKKLRRLERSHWHDAHLMGLESVSPAMARSFFRHCGVPACQGYGTNEREEEERIVKKRRLQAVAMGVASVLTALFLSDDI
jgi:hypothetical protein